MARGVRSTPTLLPTFSQNLQPASLASYDPKTRRNTILIAEIVPTVSQAPGSNPAGITFFPADRFYMNLGAPSSTAYFPLWMGGGGSGGVLQNYDSTEKAFYLDTDTGSGYPSIGANLIPMVWPTGFFGVSSSYAPKNSGVTAAWIRFKAAFTQSADYTTHGIGAVSLNATFGAAGSNFQDTASHFIQVLRNSGSWELGTCDGATISQQSGGTADSSAHEFWVKWTLSDVTLYVDGVATITKTTNLPSQPLGPAFGFDGTNKARLYDFLVEWEAA